jgi:sugar phosphate isomerase/epimerase
MNRWPLIAMENTLFSDPSLDWNARCAMIAAAGFDGIYAVPYPFTDDDFPRLHRLDEAPARHGLRLSGIYANIDLALPPEHPTNARVTRLFAETEGAPVVELSFKCSSPDALPATPSELDAAIAARLEPLLAIADRRGLKVALYPHSFYPLETPAHAARLVRRIAPPRLSYLFATSHVYAVSEPASVVAQLAACADEISSINLCGCRRTAPCPRAKCAHFPPDEGDLSLAPLIATLAAANYSGDLIIQGHGWKGDLPGMLSRCITWHAA